VEGNKNNQEINAPGESEGKGKGLGEVAAPKIRNICMMEVRKKK
jgi:hypothetical protein